MIKSTFYEDRFVYSVEEGLKGVHMEAGRLLK